MVRPNLLLMIIFFSTLALKCLYETFGRVIGNIEYYQVLICGMGKCTCLLVKINQIEQACSPLSCCWHKRWKNSIHFDLGHLSKKRKNGLFQVVFVELKSFWIIECFNAVGTVLPCLTSMFLIFLLHYPCTAISQQL